ncbi:hypothetical protein SUGI_0679920 [Cryptomeria japonica]|nr:hypothetical protein SUGI_0679920 [Cryptomeria japonica]
MESTSTSAGNTGRQPEEGINASEEIAVTRSTSATPSLVSLFLCCFNWCALFRSEGSVQSNTTMASVATTSKELELGDCLPKEIEDAMQNASLHLAIFSENYAQSPWCLAELSFMLKSGAPIVPVFYHVKPDDVRYAKGVYAKAFSRHEEKGRYTSEKLQEWKNALQNVSYNVGHIVSDKDDEGRLLKNIVSSVLKVIQYVPLVVAKHPVGLDEAVKDFEMTTLQSADSHHPVQIVGIWGMGGSGKTTLAKQIYNNKYTSMERCSFILDVRDAAAKGVLHKKQKKLLEDLGLKDVRVDDIEEGKGMLACRLRSVQVLIVVDDVDNVEQLDALLPNKDGLGWGSLIVVTTRELDVLRSWGISSIYKMKKLDAPHAKQLFCWHAFLNSSPLAGFEDLVENFLDVCNGLPLSLKVLGAQLYDNRSKDSWETQLDKVRRIMPNDIKQKLKVSYDALDDEEKEIFLDIACFFIGEEIASAIDVWDGSRWSGLHSWERLLNKCLVEMDNDDCIRMHDHIRDLGREIANQKSPYRLWYPQQIIKTHNEAQGIGIRGIMSTTDGYMDGIEESPRFSGGKIIVNRSGGYCSLQPSSLGLKIFKVRGNHYNQVIGDMPRELVWLRWFHFGQRNLSSLSSLKNLRVLEIDEEMKDNHLEELWENDSNAPEQLRRLVISNCHKFQILPNSIGRLNHLKKLVVSGGNLLSSLPEEFCLLQSLEHLKLMCYNLSSLPRNFGDLRKLRHLELHGCMQFRTLPVSFKELILLQHLCLSLCFNLTLESNILENMIKLEHVSLNGCTQLEELPPHITNQASLKNLHLYGWKRLKQLPMNIGRLSKLRRIEIGTSNLLTSLPISLGDLPVLTHLQIVLCPKLESLPDSIGQLSNLQTLEIDECPIRHLDLRASPSGSFTSSLYNLKRIRLLKTKVSKISISQDSCPGLETLYIDSDQNLMEIEVLPTTVKDIELQKCEMLRNIRGIVGLVDIQKLTITGCPKLDELPSFAQLTSLQELQLQGCYRVENIQGLEHCRALEMLRVDSRWEAAGIESLESMEKLRRVELIANRRSGVEACIQSIQNWAGEIIGCTRAVPDAASLLSFFAFPGVSLLHSLDDQIIDGGQYTQLMPKSSPNGNAAIVCFVINCVTPSMQLRIGNSSTYDQVSETEVENGRWIWMGVFRKHSRWHTAEEYRIGVSYFSEGVCEVERGSLLVMGEDDRVMEAFRRLWALLAN